MYFLGLLYIYKLKDIERNLKYEDAKSAAPGIFSDEDEDEDEGEGIY